MSGVVLTEFTVETPPVVLAAGICGGRLVEAVELFDPEAAVEAGVVVVVAVAGAVFVIFEFEDEPEAAVPLEFRYFCTYINGLMVVSKALSLPRPALMAPSKVSPAALASW